MNPLTVFLTILAIGGGVALALFMWLLWWFCFMAVKGACIRK